MKSCSQEHSKIVQSGHTVLGIELRCIFYNFAHAFASAHDHVDVDGDGNVVISLPVKSSICPLFESPMTKPVTMMAIAITRVSVVVVVGGGGNLAEFKLPFKLNQFISNRTKNCNSFNLGFFR